MKSKGWFVAQYLNTLDLSGINYSVSGIWQLILSLFCQTYHQRLDPTEKDTALLSDLASWCGPYSLIRGWPSAIHLIQWPHVPLLKNGGSSLDAIICMAQVTRCVGRNEASLNLQYSGIHALQMGAGVWMCQLLALWPWESYLPTGKSVSKVVN